MQRDWAAMYSQRSVFQFSLVHFDWRAQFLTRSLSTVTWNITMSALLIALPLHNQGLLRSPPYALRHGPRSVVKVSFFIVLPSCVSACSQCWQTGTCNACANVNHRPHRCDCTRRQNLTLEAPMVPRCSEKSRGMNRPPQC